VHCFDIPLPLCDDQKVAPEESENRLGKPFRGAMDIMGRFSNPQVLEGWQRLATSPLKKRPVAAPVRGKNTRRYRAVKRLVIEVLEQERRPLWPAEIERLIKSRTDEQVARSSIKHSLWAGSRQRNGSFIREPNGYRLRDNL
jgi:hypothetical protein